MNTFT